MSQRSPVATLASLRRLLLAIILVGLAGTATDLLLIGHDEDAWQVIPLAVLFLAMLASVGVIATRIRSGTAAVRLFQITMVLLIVSGAMGSVLHYRANMEFKREMDPSLSGFALFSSVVQAQSPPALAPGNMTLLGLFGLACAFRLDVDTT